MIEALFGPGYQIIQLFVEPSHAGHGGIARRRTYMFILDTSQAEYLFDVHEIYRDITARIMKTVQTEPKDYLVSPDYVRMLDEQQTCLTRKIQHDPETWLTC